MFRVCETIKVPDAATSVSFGSPDVLVVGSADGTLRLYELPSTRVVKALRRLGDEVSSVAWLKSCENDRGIAWIASGRKAYSFDLSSPKMVLTVADAQRALDLGEDDEDVLNELNVSENKKSLIFGTDNGSVGTVDLSTHEISRVKSIHDSICGSVKFIPSRPNEVVSGGYDSTLLHFDVARRSVLSRHKITAPEPSDSVSLSPPFVLSLAVSASGLVAAGLADGRVWLGAGGDKNAPNPSKRTRKWEGLRETDAAAIQIAKGPVVGIVFIDQVSILTCTLLGRVMMHTLSYNTEGSILLQTTWNSQTEHVAKVNAIAFNTKRLAIAGLDTDGKGIVEIWVPLNSTESA